MNRTFLEFTAFLLVTEHKSNSVKFKQAISLVVPLEKALKEISLFWNV